MTDCAFSGATIRQTTVRSRTAPSGEGPEGRDIRHHGGGDGREEGEAHEDGESHGGLRCGAALIDDHTLGDRPRPGQPKATNRGFHGASRAFRRPVAGLPGGVQAASRKSNS